MITYYSSISLWKKILGFLTWFLYTTSVKAVPYDDQILKNPAEWQYNYALGYKQLASGLCCGLSSLAAGLAIGVVGDAGVRANGQKNILIALILMMIFAEALALYGFIIAIVLVMSS